MNKKFILCFVIFGLFFINLVHAENFDVRIGLNDFYYGDKIECSLDVKGDINEIEKIIFRWSIWYPGKENPHYYGCSLEGEDKCDFVSENELSHTFEIDSSYFGDLETEIYGVVEIVTKSGEKVKFIGESKILSSRPLTILNISIDKLSVLHGETISLTSESFIKYGYIGSKINKKFVSLQCCEGVDCFPGNVDFCSNTSRGGNISCDGQAWGYPGEQIIRCYLYDWKGFSNISEVKFTILDGETDKKNYIGTSREGVKYESELLKKLKENEWVKVIVDIRDTSNFPINAAYLPNESKENDLSRKNLFEDITSDVLEDLNDSEFKLSRKSDYGSFFSGDITLEGFEKLIKDNRIGSIHENKEIKGILLDSTNKFKQFEKLISYILLVILLGILVFLLIKTQKRKKLR